MILTIALGIVLAVIILMFLPVVLTVVGAFLAVIFSPKEPLTKEEINEQRLKKEIEAKQLLIKQEVRKENYRRRREKFFNFIKLSLLFLIGFLIQIISLQDMTVQNSRLLVTLSFLAYGAFFYYSRRLKKLGKSIFSQTFRSLMTLTFICYYIAWIMLILG